jgi:peptidoglycan/xylan/chitin deacetylase (PgdA/CDA1 family)
VVSTSPRTFRQHIGFLHDSGYRGIKLSELTTLLEEGKPLPERAVVITFDDGYYNFYSHAWPVLREHEFEATVFLVTGYCGKDNGWPGHEPANGRQLLMGWPEIRELHSQGVEFGSHTVTHPDLRRLPKERIESELTDSKARIQDEVGAHVSQFAFPYGYFDSGIKAIVEREFAGACTTKLGRVDNDSDRHELRRIEMYYFSRRPTLELIVDKQIDRYLAIRQALREVRRAFK